MARSVVAGGAGVVVGGASSMLMSVIEGKARRSVKAMKKDVALRGKTASCSSDE